jgi:DNA-binding NarL/FixJ family response regulator
MRNLSKLTVVVLTDSMQPEHIKRALDLGADLFQVKPNSHADRKAMVQALEDYMNKRRSTFAKIQYASEQPDLFAAGIY